MIGSAVPEERRSASSTVLAVVDEYCEVHADLGRGEAGAVCGGVGGEHVAQQVPYGFGGRRQGLVCNPQITLAVQPDLDTDYEGCLSLPGAYHPVARPDFAICQGQDQFGETRVGALTGRSASSAFFCDARTEDR